MTSLDCYHKDVIACIYFPETNYHVRLLNRASLEFCTHCNSLLKGHASFHTSTASNTQQTQTWQGRERCSDTAIKYLLLDETENRSFSRWVASFVLMFSFYLLVSAPSICPGSLPTSWRNLDVTQRMAKQKKRLQNLYCNERVKINK